MKNALVAKDNFKAMDDYLAQTSLLMFRKCSKKYDTIIKDIDKFNERIHEISYRIFLLRMGNPQDFIKNRQKCEEEELNFFKDYGISEEDEELFRCLFFHHYLLRLALIFKVTNDRSLFKTIEKELIEHRELNKEILRPIEKELGLDLP